MAQANIIITQGLAGAPAGQSYDQAVTGSPVTLRNASNSGVEVWRWSLLARPLGSVAVLSGPQSAVATVTPDVPGSYLVELRVNGGLVGETQRVLVVVRQAIGGGALPVISPRVPAAGEAGEANWAGNVGGAWQDDARIKTAALAAYAAVDTVGGDISALQSDVADLQAKTGAPTDTLGVTGSPAATPLWATVPEMSAAGVAGQYVEFAGAVELDALAAGSTASVKFRYALDGTPFGLELPAGYLAPSASGITIYGKITLPVLLPRERLASSGTVTVEWILLGGAAAFTGTDRRLRVWP